MIIRKNSPALLFLLAVAFILPPAPLKAASPLAENHTILYYLVESQRRFTKQCDGLSMPEAPSLMPSESLRELAARRAHGASASPPADLPELTGIPHFIAAFPGQDPRLAFNSLRASQCSPLMRQEYRYIGAAEENGHWTLILAAAEPERPSSAASPVQDHPDPDAASREDPAEPAPDAEILRQETSVSIMPPAIMAAPAGSATLPAIGGVPSLAPGLPGGIAGGNLEVGVIAPKQDRPGIVALTDERSPAPPVFSGTNEGERAANLPASPVMGGEERGTSPTSPVMGEEERAASSSSPIMIPAVPAGPDPADALLALVNETRARGAQCGGTPMRAVRPLARNTALSAAAGVHAADMTARRYFSSTSPEAVTLGGRVTAAGVEWAFVAENIAGKTENPDTVLQTWMADKGQCQNLMSPDYSIAGVAYDPAGRHWVLTLASPMGKGDLPLR